MSESITTSREGHEDSHEVKTVGCSFVNLRALRGSRHARRKRWMSAYGGHPYDGQAARLVAAEQERPAAAQRDLDHLQRPIDDRQCLLSFPADRSALVAARFSDRPSRGL